MQNCQFLWTSDFFVDNVGVVPLEGVKVLTACAQGRAVEEAAIAIDVRVVVVDQPGTASSKSLYKQKESREGKYCPFRKTIGFVERRVKAEGSVR